MSNSMKFFFDLNRDGKMNLGEHWLAYNTIMGDETEEESEETYYLDTSDYGEESDSDFEDEDTMDDFGYDSDVFEDRESDEEDW